MQDNSDPLRMISGGGPGPAPERATAGAPPLGIDAAWALLLALRRAVDAGMVGHSFDHIVGTSGHATGRVTVDLDRRRIVAGTELFDVAACELLDLFVDIAAAPRGDGLVVAMLGQSLDGYIATRPGDSRYVNGHPSLVHQHRLRALSDAVLVGASTALLDDPRLTTRHVSGPNPVRVVVDPSRRLPARHGLLCDGAAATLVVRAGAAEAERRLTDQALELSLEAADGRLCPHRVVQALAARGLGRLMVEGGGVTVTRFLQAAALDRLQLAVAPLLLGAGRRAIDLPAVERLADGLRPRSRSYSMGEDVLFDLAFERSHRAASPRHRDRGKDPD